MTPKKVSFADFQSAIMAPGLIAGAKTLNTIRDKNFEMYVGADPGFLTVHAPNGDGEEVEILIPLMNVKSVVVIREKAEKKK